MSGALAALETLRDEAGPSVALRRAALLAEVGRSRLATAAQVGRFHEVLCFLRAYPDDARVAALAERLSEGFARRADLRRHAAALADSGIAGTTTRFPFFQATAAWLARRWPGQLRFDAEGGAPSGEVVERLLSLVTHWAESPGLDEVDLGIDAWLRRLAGPRAAAFLVGGLDALPADGFVREYLHERLDLWLELLPGADTPNRTRALWRGPGLPPVAYRREPLARGRPDLKAVLRARPVRVTKLSRADGQRLVELAREAMVSRSRDLDVFTYGDPDDARLIAWEDGLSFAALGALPERRLLLESVYGLLTLKNGVPIGYVLLSALCGSSEIAYNVFPTWRGGEAAHVYGRVLATARHLFGSDSFTVYPYQLGGDGNDEALASGAWWFYRKLGFAPKDAGVLRLVRREEAALKRKPGHRSSIATLAKIASENVYFHAGRARSDVIGLLPLSHVGLAVTDLLRTRFGHDRAHATAVCEQEAAAALRLRSRRGWSAGERLAFTRWAPLVLLLRAARWPAADRRALLAVIRAKGGTDEAEFVRRFDAHRRLRRGIVALARRTEA